MYISNEQLTRIKNFQTSGKCVSLFMPTHQSTDANTLQQDRTRFKNAIQQLKQDYTDNLSADIINNLEALLDDTEFWKYQDKGLAVFAAEDHLEYIPLSVAVNQAVFVEDHFVVTPLYCLASVKSDYYVLDVNITKPRLLSVSGNAATEINDANLPQSLEEESNRDEYRKHLQHQPVSISSHGNAGVHGHDPADSYENDIDWYLGELAEVVDEYLKDKTELLILAGTNDRTSSLRPKLNYQEVSEEPIDGNIEKDSPQNVLVKSQPIINKYTDDYWQEINEKIASTAPQLLLVHATEILEAAETGRIDSLYLPAFISTSDGLLFNYSEEQTKHYEQIVRAVLDQNGKIQATLDTNSDPDAVRAICRY